MSDSAYLFEGPFDEEWAADRLEIDSLVVPPEMEPVFTDLADDGLLRDETEPVEQVGGESDEAWNDLGLDEFLQDSPLDIHDEESDTTLPTAS